jgi:hypothetical protein
MTAFPTTHVRTSKLHRMDHDARIKSAITDLESQNHPNIAAAAKKWGVVRETLSKRFRGETISHREAASYVRKKLTDVQEDIFIKHINKLSDQGLSSTLQIIKNLAEEIIHAELKKNWVFRFIRRYYNQLISVYLRTIDHKRKITDNSHYFKHFFNTVRIIFA